MDAAEACRTGDLAWLEAQARKTRLDLNQKAEDSSYSPIDHAIIAGNLEVLVWVRSVYNALENTRGGVGGAAPDLVDFSSANSYSVKIAAAFGHLDIIKWLIFDSGSAVDASATGSYALQIAVNNSHLDVVKWLATDYNAIIAEMGPSRPHNLKHVNPAAEHYLAFNFAANTDQLETLKFLVEDFSTWFLHHRRLLSGSGLHLINAAEWIRFSGGWEQRQWSPAATEYIHQTAAMQEQLGLEVWAEAISMVAKKPLSRL